MLVDQESYFHHRPFRPEPVRWWSIFWFLCLLTVLACLSLLGTERVLLAQGNTYPSWLADTSPVLHNGFVNEFHDRTCGGKEPVEIFPKPTQIVLRCGIWWLHSHTVVLPRTPETERLIAQ